MSALSKQAILKRIHQGIFSDIIDGIGMLVLLNGWVKVLREWLFLFFAVFIITTKVVFAIVNDSLVEFSSVSNWTCAIRSSSNVMII